MLLDAVARAIRLETLVTGRIEIVRQNPASFLGGWNGKGSHTRHDVRDDLVRLEAIDETRVFGVQPRVPVDPTKVEREGTPRLGDDYVVLVFPREQLHVKEAELDVNGVELVDDCPDRRIFLPS